MTQKEQTFPNISQILPHRPPILLADRITGYQPGEWIEAEFSVQPDLPVFAGHFPDRPMLPGVYMIESMAQTADLLLLQTEGNSGLLPVLFQVNAMRFYRPVFPGDLLSLCAKLLSDAGNGLYECEVSASVNGKRAAAGRITLALRP